jgi:hypothetical protein
MRREKHSCLSIAFYRGRGGVRAEVIPIRPRGRAATSGSDRGCGLMRSSCRANHFPAKLHWRNAFHPSTLAGALAYLRAHTPLNVTLSFPTIKSRGASTCVKAVSPWRWYWRSPSQAVVNQRRAQKVQKAKPAPRVIRAHKALRAQQVHKDRQVDRASPVPLELLRSFAWSGRHVRVHWIAQSRAVTTRSLLMPFAVRSDRPQPTSRICRFHAARAPTLVPERSSRSVRNETLFVGADRTDD